MNEQLKPFQQVLVRDSKDLKWQCSLFSHKDNILHKLVTLSGCYQYCIPYEGNEALLGTTDDAPRWRADFGGSYWYVAEDVTAMEVCETYERWDNQRYELGNYFRTEEEAQAMADKFKEMLKGGEQ